MSNKFYCTLKYQEHKHLKKPDLVSQNIDKGKNARDTDIKGRSDASFVLKIMKMILPNSNLNLNHFSEWLFPTMKKD